MQGYRPDTYGEAFADVYDEWYRDISSPEATARFVASRTTGFVLELGSGTGRLAAPFATDGVDIVGLDASQSMLSASRVRAPSVPVLRGDMVSIPVRSGSCGAVLLAFNTLFNLPTVDLQRSALAEIARVLADDGVFVVETFVPDTSADVDQGSAVDALDIVRMDTASIVLRASRTDPSTSVVFGHHIELRDGEPVRLRPWHLCYCSPTELDERTAAVGLSLRERYADWDGAPFGELSSHQVCVYSPARRHR